MNIALQSPESTILMKKICPLDHGCNSLRRKKQATLSILTVLSFSWGITRCSQIRGNLVYPGFSSQWNMPRNHPEKHILIRYMSHLNLLLSMRRSRCCTLSFTDYGAYLLIHKAQSGQSLEEAHFICLHLEFHSFGLVWFVMIKGECWNVQICQSKTLSFSSDPSSRQDKSSTYKTLIHHLSVHPSITFEQDTQRLEILCLR